MSYLIDTHILIWYIEGNKQLNQKLIDMINKPANAILISQASLWEMTIKISISKLKLSLSLPDLRVFLINRNFQIIDYNFYHLETLLHLPFHHQDPFDRMIIAQAITENLTILTNDAKFKDYPANIFFN